MAAGRYAPSPTSDLHLGNLRTAMVAWLLSRHAGEQFFLRIEDLDTQRVRAAGDVASRQLHDLEQLGLDWDGPVLVQSQRLDLYADALCRIETYPCFCSRRDIAEASSAPHAQQGRYPGTCRALSPAERQVRAHERPGALRIAAHHARSCITDRWAGEVCDEVDDVVVVRNDGCFAYNLASVVDDALTGVSTVCRGRDLLSVAPAQAWLATQLGFEAPRYAHIGLVTNEHGQRLSKRDGAVTLRDLQEAGWSVGRVRALLASSLGLADPAESIDMTTLLGRFDPSSVAASDWVYCC